MKKQLYQSAFLLLQLILFSCSSFSQQKEFTFPKSIPPFNLILSDGVTSFNASNLQKNKAVIIIYFDPDCDHCKKFINTITKNIQQFASTQIIMICSASSITPVQKFVADNALSKYSFIKVGTEGIYHATMSFYHVEITPFTAVYNTKGILISYYREAPAIKNLIADLKK